MSSRHTTPPSDDDPLSDIYDAMAQSSPLAPSRVDKRPHSEVDQDDDEMSAPGTLPPTNPASTPQNTTAPATVNQNLVAAVARFAERKRLKAEQKAELEVFIQDLPALREAKAYGTILLRTSKVEEIVNEAPPWQPTADLLRNAANYSAGVLLSSKIRTYKGSVPTNIVIDILKKRSTDIPPGTEHNPAEWSKLTAAVQDALTQKRARFKKLIAASLNPTDKKSKEHAPKEERLNIFQLTQAFVEGTRCSSVRPHSFDARAGWTEL
ncbi:hypothetical protein R3P38DRAFT_3228968 [Favolaschia claudopus]|uniref:Uncharacterized protein n=1 Tax=Favolaschia claudopus TaxID=2862362 RepID=A0AAV9ZQB0_9AGAR